MSIIVLSAGDQSSPPAIAAPVVIERKNPVAPVMSIQAAKNPPATEAFNRKLVTQIARVQSKSRDDKAMRDYLIFALTEWLKCDDVTQDKGNIYATKGVPVDGGFYPCYVAHMDTVHDVIAQDDYRVWSKDKDQLFAWNIQKETHTGVGGDDKVGIFLALECLRTLPACKVAFFRDEEIGCLGSRDANLDFFKDCSFVLQGDRRGNEDFIRKASGETLHGDEFAALVKPKVTEFGFKEYTFGAGTDVAALRRIGLDLCCANVSCGYFNFHSKDEYIILGDVERTLNLFLVLATTIAEKQWRYEEPKQTFPNYHQGWTGTFRPLYRDKIVLAGRGSEYRNGAWVVRTIEEKREWDRRHASVIWKAIKKKAKAEFDRQYAEFEPLPPVAQKLAERIFSCESCFGNNNVTCGDCVVQKANIAANIRTIGMKSESESPPVDEPLEDWADYGLCDDCVAMIEVNEMCMSCQEKVERMWTEIEAEEEAEAAAIIETRARVKDSWCATIMRCPCGAPMDQLKWDFQEDHFYCLGCDQHLPFADARTDVHPPTTYD